MKPSEPFVGPVLLGVVVGLLCELFISHTLGMKTTIAGDLVAASISSTLLANRLNKGRKS